MKTRNTGTDYSLTLYASLCIWTINLKPWLLFNVPLVHLIGSFSCSVSPDLTGQLIITLSSFSHVHLGRVAFVQISKQTVYLIVTCHAQEWPFSLDYSHSPSATCLLFTWKFTKNVKKILSSEFVKFHRHPLWQTWQTMLVSASTLTSMTKIVSWRIHSDNLQAGTWYTWCLTRPIDAPVQNLKKKSRCKEVVFTIHSSYSTAHLIDCW